MSKRASDALGCTPAPKQARIGGDTPATTSVRPHGRVVLDVGGTRFVSSKTTLEGSSSYFSALLARWDENAEPLFIDSDPDAFCELLSYMRSGTLMLPQHDARLCGRVLLQAEYLGMDGLLEEVKSQTYANLYPDTHADETRPLAAAFDEECGSIAAAIRSKVLPDRYFAPAPKPPPEPPLRTIKALLPAAPGYRALFTNGTFEDGESRDTQELEDPATSESLHIVSWALVEYRDGSQKVDAVVQRDLDATKEASYIERGSADGMTQSHLQLASEYHGNGEDGYDFADADTRHWLVVPPRAPGQLLPIPPGSVRGLWSVPALTPDDVGKSITIEGDRITVDGEVRNVLWSGDAPKYIINKSITRVTPWGGFDSRVTVAGLTTSFEIPRIESKDMEIDLAFASVQREGTDALKTSFYMPVHERGAYTVPSTHLGNAMTVGFGDRNFCSFVGAKRT